MEWCRFGHEKAPAEAGALNHESQLAGSAAPAHIGAIGAVDAHGATATGAAIDIDVASSVVPGCVEPRSHVGATVETTLDADPSAVLDVAGGASLCGGCADAHAKGGNGTKSKQMLHLG